jgi:hypothetical protein
VRITLVFRDVGAESRGSFAGVNTMARPGRGGRGVCAGWLAAGLVLAPLSCASPPPPAVVPSPKAEPGVPQPLWLAIDVPPEPPGQCEHVMRTSGGVLCADHAGRRWLLGQPPSRAASFDPRVSGVFWHEGLGVTAVGVDRRVLAARDPLGPLLPIGELPAGVDPAKVSHFRGGLSAPGGKGFWVAPDRTHWTLAHNLSDRAPSQVLVGRDGRGIGLFYPLLAGTTPDGGASWSKLDIGPREYGDLVPRGNVVLVAGDAYADKWSAVWRPGDTQVSAVDASTIPPDPDRPSREPRRPPESLPVTVRHATARALAAGQASLAGNLVVGVSPWSHERRAQSLWSIGSGQLGEGLAGRRCRADVPV